jgi:hypothetical protein
MAGGGRSGRFGAQPAVLRAIGLDSGRSSIARSSEGALCSLCRSALEFDTIGDYATLVERCSGTNNRDCPNRRWRQPQVDPSILLPPDPPKVRRNHASTGKRATAAAKREQRGKPDA